MQVFNYRLSRACRVIENTFGILGARFRCLLAPLEMDVKRVESIVLGCCTLHNILCERNRTSIATQVDQEDPNNGALIAGSWRKDRAKKTLEDLKKMKGNTGSEAAKDSI